MSRRVHIIVSAALMLSGLGGGALRARAQESQAQASNGSPVMLPPKITYEGGQLTIVAENSSLSDVMSALHTVLGADIDLPASASSERVWVRLGPGPARKVLSELLSGTDLNFVIQGSPTDVDGIRSVMLTPHTDATSAGTAPGSIPEPPERVARRFAGSRQEVTEPPQQENPPAAAPESVTPPVADAAATTPPTAPMRPAAADAATVSTTADVVAHPSPPESLTPENISQQLLSMYEQRRQLNQQMHQAPPPTPSPSQAQ